jgi:O-acetyl-ADP-ribose deacetylase (regulator of RNase III)
VDAIVNAANSGLMGGGGVDGAIHRAGGPQILEECKTIRAQQGTCAPGNAVITCGGNLRAKYVIHAVGPIWHGGTSNESEVLVSAYKASLELAESYELKTIAFPSISTGAYGFPIDLASKIAITTAKEFCSANTLLSEIRFVLFDQFTYDHFEQALGSGVPQERH